MLVISSYKTFLTFILNNLVTVLTVKITSIVTYLTNDLDEEKSEM